MGIKAQAGHYLFQQGNWPLTGFGIQIEVKAVTKLHLKHFQTLSLTHSTLSLSLCPSQRHSGCIDKCVSCVSGLSGITVWVICLPQS